MVSVRFRGANLSVRSFNAARDCDSFHHTAATTAYSSLPSTDYAARGALVLFPHLGSHSSVERFCCYCIIKRALFQRQSQCRNPCRTHSSPSLMTVSYSTMSLLLPTLLDEYSSYSSLQSSLSLKGLYHSWDPVK